MTRIVPYAIAVGLALGLSACTNPYDPVQRGLGRGHIGSRFWCCDWSGGGWRAGSRPRSSHRRRNRNSWRSCDYTSARARHLLRLPSLRISRLRISGLCAGGLWISGLLGILRLFRSSGLWLPEPPGLPPSLLRFRLWRSRRRLPRRPPFGVLVALSRVRRRARSLSFGSEFTCTLYSARCERSIKEIAVARMVDEAIAAAARGPISRPLEGTKVELLIPPDRQPS